MLPDRQDKKQHRKTFCRHLSIYLLEGLLNQGTDLITQGAGTTWTPAAAPASIHAATAQVTRV